MRKMIYNSDVYDCYTEDDVIDNIIEHKMWGLSEEDKYNITYKTCSCCNQKTKEILFKVEKSDEELKEFIKQDITEKQIEQEYEELSDLDWQDFKDNLKYANINGQFALFGTVGLWNGNRRGYKILGEDITNIIKAMYDYDYIKLFTEDNRTFIELSHHDGTHYMELMQVSEYGKEKIEYDLEDLISDYNPIDKCWESVDLHKLIWGN